MDFLKMMKQAKEMQSRMATLQEELASIEVAGSAGAGLVAVTIKHLDAGFERQFRLGARGDGGVAA